MGFCIATRNNIGSCNGLSYWLPFVVDMIFYEETKDSGVDHCLEGKEKRKKEKCCSQHYLTMWFYNVGHWNVSMGCWSLVWIWVILWLCSHGPQNRSTLLSNLILTCVNYGHTIHSVVKLHLIMLLNQTQLLWVLGRTTWFEYESLGFRAWGGGSVC